METCWNTNCVPNPLQDKLDTAAAILNGQGAADFHKLHIHAGSSSAAKQNAYAMIHEEMASLKSFILLIEKETYVWKSRYNTLSDIHKLPEEILAQIFRFLAHDARPAAISWISVTQVCSHWRKISLNYPQIWSKPDFHNPSLATEMIKRAKACPLIIEFAANACPLDLLAYYTPRFQLIAQNMGRAKFLGLTTSWNLERLLHMWSDLVNTILQKPAPLLERLHLSAPPWFPVSLAACSFSGVFSRLRDISIQNGSLIPSFLPIGQRITTLKIVNIDYLAQAYIPVPHMIEYLKSFPRLENLHLTNAMGPPPSRENASSLPVVDLPELRQLTVKEFSDRCKPFFRMVKFPWHTNVKVEFTAGDEQLDQPAEHIIRKLTNRRKLDFPLKMLHVRGHSKTERVNLLAFTHWLQEPWECPRHLYRSFIGTPLIPSRIVRLGDILPLQHLSVLEYSLRYSCVDFWKNIGQLQQLSTLSIYFNHIEFLDVLAQPRESHSGASQTNAKLYFPYLTGMVLFRWKFWGLSDRLNENSGIIGAEQFSPPNDHITLNSFEHALLSRQQSGKYFRGIHVVKSRFTPQHIERMKVVTEGKTTWVVEA